MYNGRTRANIRFYPGFVGVTNKSHTKKNGFATHLHPPPLPTTPNDKKKQDYLVKSKENYEKLGKISQKGGKGRKRKQKEELCQKCGGGGASPKHTYVRPR